VNLLEAVEIPIGTVKAFAVRGVEAVNDGHGGRRLVVKFTKPLADAVKPKTVQQWIKVTPAPKKLTATVEGATVEFSGEFKLETEYKVEWRAGSPRRNRSRS